jgi:hypothetical protein
MGVPDQVRKQTEQVQQLYADLNGGNDQSDEKRPIDGDVSSDAATASQANLKVVASDSANDKSGKSGADEPVSGGQDEQSFEQKYRTLQGKYNAEVPTLNAQVRDLNGRLGHMQQLLSTMQSARPNANSQKAPPPQSTLTDEEREEYGESIDVMRKVTQEVVTPYQQEIERLNQMLAQMQGSVVPRVEQLSQQQAHSAEQQFWSSLANEVPNWKEINDSQDFQTWLLETDPLSGMARQAYLEDAQRRLDSHRVAGFFQAWQNASGHTAQPTRSAASELEKQVTPGRTRSSPAPRGDQQKTYKTSDVAKFYDNVRKGAFKGREEERGRLERDIFAAQAEGRIVQA